MRTETFFAVLIGCFVVVFVVGFVDLLTFERPHVEAVKSECSTPDETSREEDKQRRSSQFGPMQQFTNPGRHFGWVGF